MTCFLPSDYADPQVEKDTAQMLNTKRIRKAPLNPQYTKWFIWSDFWSTTTKERQRFHAHLLIVSSWFFCLFLTWQPALCFLEDIFPSPYALLPNKYVSFSHCHAWLIIASRISTLLWFFFCFYFLQRISQNKVTLQVSLKASQVPKRALRPKR